MRIGVPKEIKPQENRIGLTPESVKTLVSEGHEVLVENNGGFEAGFENEQYTNAGAKIANSAADIFNDAEIIVKVKEPQKVEVDMIRENQIVYTYLHLAAAKELKKPLIIHSREAKLDVIKILKEEKAHEVGGVMHCFVDDLETAKAAIDMDFLISFSGIVTFKNAKPLQEVARQISLKNMLIETDSPYLAPTPHRGKTNQPAYVRYVAEFLAELKEESLEDVALNTTKNYEDKFNKINTL